MDDAVTHGEGRTRFTDFRMTMKTNMPVFKVDVKDIGHLAETQIFIILFHSYEKSLCGGATLSSNG